MPKPKKPETIVHDRTAKDLLAAGQYAPMEVADPFDPKDKITVLRQLRCDPLARLHSHHQIDEAQYHAGRCYQRDWEIAERGARAIDPTREAVDGGRLPEPMTDGQGRARIRLVEIERALGRQMHKVAHGVLIEGKSVEAIANRLYEHHGQNANRHVGRLFRDALDTLAVEYGLAVRN